MKTILSVALTLAVAVAALPHGPAAAQALPAETRVAVRYADLDLATDAGIRALGRRILTAVRQVCGPVSDFDLAGDYVVRVCRAEALARLATQWRAAVAAATSSMLQLAPQR